MCVFGSQTFVSNSWMSDISSWSYDMEGRAKKCVERYIKITRMRRTSSRRSIRLYPGQNARCTTITEKFQGPNVQIFGYVYQNTNGQNHGPVWKTQLFLLNEMCTVMAGLLRERQFEKVLLQRSWGKVPNWTHARR